MLQRLKQGAVWKRVELVGRVTNCLVRLVDIRTYSWFSSFKTMRTRNKFNTIEVVADWNEVAKRQGRSKEQE